MSLDHPGPLAGIATSAGSSGVVRFYAFNNRESVISHSGYHPMYSCRLVASTEGV